MVRGNPDPDDLIAAARRNLDGFCQSFPDSFAQRQAVDHQVEAVHAVELGGGLIGQLDNPAADPHAGKTLASHFS